MSGPFTVTGATSYGTINLKYKDVGSVTIIFLEVDDVTLPANTYMNIKSDAIEALVQKLLAKVGLPSTSMIAIMGISYIDFFAIQYTNGFVLRSKDAINNHYISSIIVL